ncbi:hypothetical protein BH23VER1_BH23VER1_03210 [soil metagenome]
MPSSVKKPNLVSVTTINRDGSHFVLHPADVSGVFTRWRRLFGLFLLLVYIALPWIPVNGHPAVFFDLVERRFHFFGLTFLTPDLWIAFFLITGLGFGLFYVTALFGRLWCGWACPYTVFLEHVFRRIERWTDGDAPARRALDRAPWNGSKIARRLLKHGLYLLCSALIAHIFLSYFVSLERLYGYMRGSPLEHVQAFGVVLFLTAVLYFCFAWFREQFCIVMCPYGRIQSALTDDDTLVIGYDAARGEPRGKATDPTKGDCIACHRCVQVCPTGIDIRNGLQLECIGCSACIDACDNIMDKVGRPRGLIRYDSLRGLAGQATRWVRPRTVLYSALLALGMAVFGISLTTLHDVDLSITRMGDQAYYIDDGLVRNHYQVRASTKRNRPTTFSVDIVGLPPAFQTSGWNDPQPVPAQGEILKPLIISVPEADFTGDLTLTVRSRSQPGGTEITEDIQFVGPDIRFFRKPQPLKNSPPLLKTEP